MDLSLGSIAGSSLYGLQAASLNSKTSGASANDTNSAYYAKKGEPMYMQEMDADEDGVVSFDEFRDYCKEHNISTKQMVNMVDMANNYRTLQANEKASQSIFNKIINPENNKNSITPIDINPSSKSEHVYAQRGESKYDESMDLNSDDKVTYDEYIKYCESHAKTNESKSDTKVEKTDDGTFKTSSASKALHAYAKSSSQAPEGKYEEVA